VALEDVGDGAKESVAESSILAGPCSCQVSSSAQCIPLGGRNSQSRVPLGTFKLKFLLDLSSLPMSSSKPTKGLLQYRRGGQRVRNGVHVNLLWADVRRTVY
jgi:hypothetical protein